MQTKYLCTKTSSQGQIDAYFELIQDDGQKRLHSVAICPSDDPAKQLIALNNSLVNDLKFPAVTANEWKVVADECAQKHTPSVKAAFLTWIAANQNKA